MSDSDSDFDYSDCEDFRHEMDSTYGIQKYIFISEENYEQWSQIPLDMKKEAGQLMKVCAFWLPILLRQDEFNTTTCWAIEIGLLDASDIEAITLKQLHKIEILEAILKALEKGSLKKDQTKQAVLISNKLNSRSAEVLDDAMHWLERTGEPDIRHRIMELGRDPHTCFTTLHHIFTEFAQFIQAMGTNIEKTMKALTAQPHVMLIAKSEEMKRKGNENFQKQQYEDAVKFYSRAITLYPENHIIYGNRALCYIRCKKYLKAVVDGKRATLIKPFWAKGHYRYCEALFFLGERKMAVEANRSALTLCKSDLEGIKDLEQQQQKFVTEMADCKAGRSKKSQSSRSEAANKKDASESRPQAGKVGNKTNQAAGPAPQSKASGVNTDKQAQPAKKERTAQAERGTKDSNSAAKKTSKNKNCHSEDEPAANSKAKVCKELRSLMQDAHAALTDLRSRNAEQAFRQALALLDANTPKELGLSALDVQLLLFGRASALTEIGQPEKLAEAQRLLKKIKSFEDRTFQCLVYYAIGKVYLKENRFAMALEQFSDSLQMVKNQITPGKLTWPLTKDIVRETETEYFKEVLDNAIEACKFPPVPHAVCRQGKCLGPKHEIYFTDPDFKGFIQLCCSQSCTIEYHIICWKSLKTSSPFERNEKDFLQEACLTPDCDGQICSIKIFDPTGLVKCKFETAISKLETPKKPKVNQKCPSQKKLKSKEDYQLKKKKQEPSCEDNLAITNDALRQRDDSPAHRQQRAWLLYRDRVLLQISQNMELFREERGLHVSTLSRSLKPWLELDLSRGSQQAVMILNWQELESLGQAVELLLERKNRIWARVLVQELSSSQDVNPKLNNWACRLNKAGLNAAESFIERNSHHLEQLDLALLLRFGPLQDMIIEKLGTKPEFFSSIGLTVTEYLKQAPPDDMRLFIWTLEEHRDMYVSCHTILDEYFDMMDGHCSILKKPDENQNNSPIKAKSRGRKKKQKEPKDVIFLTGGRNLTPRDDWDQDILEDDPLSFLHPVDPFSVPGHLVDEVADFEELYNSTRRSSHLKNILDNNPDPTKESLYDYFAQILEEHGPLLSEDPLLVGEVENFPLEAQLKIREAGSFEAFLLESLRFIKMGRSIGLAKHAVHLQRAGLGANSGVSRPPRSLNDMPEGLKQAARKFFSSVKFAVNDPDARDYDHHPPYPSANERTLAGDEPILAGNNAEGLDGPPFNTSYDYKDLDLYDCEVDGNTWEDILYSSDSASKTAEETLLKKHAAVQTCPEVTRSVTVNTEPDKRFESFHGDVNKKEKGITELEQKISEMANGCDTVGQMHKEDIASLEEDVQGISANIQVTNKELALFQQKLEEEVKKDQKEKKANQEVLKTLKQEIEALAEEHESLAQNIRAKKTSYDEKLTNFLELSNQSAAEKMSLEDEIKRSKALLATSTKRSHAAQLSVVESRRDQALHGLHRELADAKAFLAKLDEAMHRFPSHDLEMNRKTWRANVQEAEKKISNAEAQYQEQMDQVRGGRRVSELPPVNSTSQPETPVAPMSAPQPSAPPAQQHAAAHVQQQQQRPPARPAEPAHSTVFEKAMEQLATIFPDYSRSDLMRFLKELRSSSGGNLGSMALQDVVGRVSQLILDQQEEEKLRSSANSNVPGHENPATHLPINPSPVWQHLGPQRATHHSALNLNDPCIICHDDMTPEDVCVLECRHSFHKKCIKSWLKQQSTCPTCRDHALLPEDFPVLTGRRRPAP